jgi:hypothetical protein
MQARPKRASQYKSGRFAVLPRFAPRFADDALPDSAFDIARPIRSNQSQDRKDRIPKTVSPNPPRQSGKLTPFRIRLPRMLHR